MRIDLGGIAKGAFVDRLASGLGSWSGGCIDAGGDLFVWGSPPEGDSWRIGIEDPCRPETEVLVAEVRGAAGVGVATSGIYRRRWAADERTAHHLIDPRTGSPLITDIASLTAFASCATRAEIATKALMVSATGSGNSDLFDATVAVLVHADRHMATLQGDTSHACSNSRTWPARRAA
jgi:thiamine biosynthesis lipoprotein